MDDFEKLQSDPQVKAAFLESSRRGTIRTVHGLLAKLIHDYGEI
jgi:hypothetical protein